MYTNGDGDNKNNGRKRVSLTRMTDMGVDVIDAPPAAADERVEDEEKKQDAEVGSRREGNAQSLLEEDDAPASAELLNVEEKRGAKKRVVTAAVVIIGLLVVLTALAYFWLANSEKNGMAYQVRSAEGARGSALANEQTQGITAEEIARELGKPNAAGGTTASRNSGDASSGVKTDAQSSPITDRLPLDDYSTTVNSNQAATQTATTGTQAAANAGTTQAAVNSTGVTQAEPGTTTDSRSAVERSIRVSVLQKTAKDGADSSANSSSNSTSATPASPTNAPTRSDASSPSRTNEATGVPLPPLGTMLPMRTLGAVFTLRADSYVRMQLTRDMEGRGWSLRRGTEFYGVVRGADIETGRAYISLIGFVDTNVNRLVRLQGNVLGGDGADGVRGIKHKLDSGWSRALKLAGAGAVDALSNIAAGIGRRPVYVGDIYSSAAPRAVSPIAQEISGISNGNMRRASGFVEVPAGTSCYLLVMTSPREIQGVDADVRLPATSELERLSDPSQPRAQGQMSEQELAELMTNGSPDDIRRALPRMSPEMRRVAETFLAGK
ncbi:MAG: hypothetical protein M3444_00400 [Acidobacteriota bacterium]|nr:hypothetical protein [Acidobacteriota bacterium]